jgi:ATP synthase protein I
MVIIVVLFAWGGMKLDAHQENDTPGWTISLTLLGIFAALYNLFRVVKKGSND